MIDTEKQKKTIVTLDVFRQRLEQEGYTLHSDVYVRSNIDVKVKCNNGHDWQVNWDGWKYGRRCPCCNDYEKPFTNEEIKAFLEKEGYKLNSEIQNRTYNKLEVTCPNNHQWLVSWTEFKSGTRCPQCYHKLWDTEQVREFLKQEGYALLSQYTNCKDKLDLQCPQGHKIRMSWNSFHSKKQRCSICFKQRRYFDIEKIKQLAQKENYELVSQEYTGHSDPLTFKCPQGHIWTSSLGSWRQGNRCSRCAADAKCNNLEYVKNYIESFGYKLISDVYVGTKGRIQVECPQGHEYGTCWNNFQQGHRCPACFTSRSGSEKQIGEFYRDKVVLKESDKETIKPYELDIHFIEHNIAVEYCGLYWHSMSSPGSRITADYHRKKLDLCNKKGIRLLTVFEDEWLGHKDICLSRINNALGIIENKIYARNCKVKEIENQEAYEFLNRTHLQGAGKCKVAFGLFYNDKLIQVMTFGSLSRAHTAKGKKVLELKRLASETDIVVVGGASKLFKCGKEYAKENGYEFINSYCDLRWGTGNLYEKLGFKKIHETKYTLHYTDFTSRWRNQTLAKSKNSISEGSKALKKGLHKIYDCGHQTWQLDIGD